MDDKKLPRSPFGAPKKPSQLPPMTEWRVQPPAPEPTDAPPRSFNPRWLIAGAAALAVIVAMVLILNRSDTADMIAATPVAEKAAPKVQRSAASYPPVELPSGLQIDRVSTANYDLAAWLAENPAVSRRFILDRVGFDYGSPDIREEDRPALQVLSQILTAYPQARLTVIANGPGTLSQQRTKALYDALLALAVDPAQLAMGRGDGSETAPRVDVRVEMGPVSGLDA